MSINELLPNINVAESAKHDRRSIWFLEGILTDELVDCSQLQAGGTLSNIDGYLEILDENGRAREKITVQVKHLTYSERNGKVFYDIPQSIYAYAERHKGELVFFIACDYAARKFYWRNIDTAAVEEFKNKSDHIQTKSRYYFQEREKCSEDNIRETIELWRRLYNQKMESIKDEKYLADQFASRQRMCFNAVSSELHGVKDSHIPRHQVDEIVQWIDMETEKNICLLAGDAGVGKSAVLKDLIAVLSGKGVKHLCVKADAIDENGNPVSLGDMQDTLAYYSTEADKVILIVDQIDALSQALTNDRTHLNMMMAILSSLNDWPNVRAVVSCRRYDLEYDSVLNSLKGKSTVIEIGELTEKEVATALNKLEEGLGQKVDRVTVKMLGTVHILDSFSMLFHRNKSKINFNSRIDLYDALWDDIICVSSSQDDIKEREQVMYKIAETIRTAGTLRPQFIPVSIQKRAYEYLASSGLIRRENRTVSFFHQSFYEYTLARHYYENGRLFASDIKEEIQGLGVRSTVKAVLDFKRGHDITKFAEEARSILVDPDIRLHLKLLALSVLAFENNPSRAEKSLITEVCQKDERLLVYFLRGVNSSSWLPTIRKLLNGIVSELKKDDGQFFPIISCLSRYVSDNPELVYGMVDQIQDQKSRLHAVAYILREHNDYSRPCVLKAYTDTKEQNAFFAVDLIQDATKSNIRFALSETKRLILEYLISDSSYNSHNGYELVDVLCKHLCVEYPMEMLGVLHHCICETVQKTAQSDYYSFSVTEAFNSVDGDYVGKILKMYEDLLVRYSPKVETARPLILELLSLNNETTLSMAFTAMAEAPRLYDDQIRLLSANNEKIAGYLHGDVEFFFLKMLRVWYDTLNENDAERYQRFLLSYKSEFDFKYDAERRWSQFLCPHLWQDKWELICNTLPEDHMIPEMKRCYQELLRRFRKRSIVKRHSHGCVASTCGGVVNDDVYSRWSISNWLSSFLKLDEWGWREGRNPISLSSHADAFKRCVASNPDKFHNFVSDICHRSDILDMYKVAGLEGLLSGGSDPYSLWRTTKQFITESFARESSYAFRQIAEYYIKEENKYIDEIMDICEKLVISPFSENKCLFADTDENRDMSRQATDILNMAINSYQGRAAELLVHMSSIPSRRQKIYMFFSDNSALMQRQIKAIPLYFLNIEYYFDGELYFPMMKLLLSGMGTEALYIRANAIQWSFYHRSDVVLSYIDRIESDPTSHELLAQIYFYGMAGTENPEECEMRLERILANGNEDVIAKIVEVAMKSYGHAEYHDLSVRYLERYASDDREKVSGAYCLYCDSLPVEAFNWYCGIAPVYTRKKYQPVNQQLEYVKKCVSKYPVLCYRLILSQKYYDVENASLVNDEVVKILLEIYRKLSMIENTDAMNEVLDLFDEYLYRGNRIMKDAVSLLG